MRLENDDGLEVFDTLPLAQINGESNINQEIQNEEPLLITNAFQTMASLDEDLALQTIMEESPSKRKRKQNKSPKVEELQHWDIRCTLKKLTGHIEKGVRGWQQKLLTN